MSPLVLAARESGNVLRSFWRNRSNAFFTILLPVMFLVFFGAINGQLKRLPGTPLPPWAFFCAQVVSRLVLIAAEAVLVLGLGRLLFNVSPPPSATAWVTFALVVLLGAATLLADLGRRRLPARPHARRHAPGPDLRPRARRHLARRAQAAGLADRGPGRRLADVPPGTGRLSPGW